MILLPFQSVVRRRLIATVVLLLAVVSTTTPIDAQPARLPHSIPYDFPALRHPSLEFGDLEGDGDLDLVLSGETDERPMLEVYVLDNVSVSVPDSDELYVVKVYHPLNVQAHPVSLGAVRFSDYDDDGDLDLLVTGLADYNSTQGRVVEPILEIHNNEWPPERDFGGIQSPFSLEFELPGLYRSTAAWGDFDGDGDSDFVVAGLPSREALKPVTRLYRNDGSSFAEVPTELPGIKSGAFAWGDYDGDGDVDLALTGDTLDGTYATQVYRNENGRFVDAGLDAPNLAHGSVEWGDYDADGDLDLLVTGMRLDPRFLAGKTAIFRNDGGVLVDAGFDLLGLGLGEARWGDADRDGDLDLFIVGAPYALATPTFRLFAYDGSNYVDTWEYTGNRFSALAVGDYNGDGDADAIVAGELSSGLQIRFFMNWDYPECAILWIERGFPGNC